MTICLEELRNKITGFNPVIINTAIDKPIEYFEKSVKSYMNLDISKEVSSEIINFVNENNNMNRLDMVHAIKDTIGL